MPEILKNSFYMANASSYNNCNWFVHRAYQMIFDDLVEELKTKKSSDTVNAVETVLDFIKITEPCNAVLDLRYPVKRDYGGHSVIRAFRVQHGRYRDDIPCLGGAST